MLKLGNLIYQSCWSLQQIWSCTPLSSSAPCVFFSFPFHAGACIVLHFRPTLPLHDCLFAFLPPPSPYPSRFLPSSHFLSFPLFSISSPSLLSLITLLTIISPACPTPFPVSSHSFTIFFLVTSALTSSFPLSPLFVPCPFSLPPIASHSSSVFLPSH